uniref:TIR domain-containing protein n=1 Tax=Magallana gigas TaxID=29159 RepID=A0A8W8KFU1_MAGGI|nr:toll-like receptor 4 [Crassostrea gigas]
MALNNAKVSWMIALTVVVFNTKCSSINFCPNTPCLCTNTTTDCSDRNLESLQLLENQLPKTTTNIILSGNIFMNVGDFFLKPIESLKIEKISLCRCQVKYISPIAFRFFPHIKQLDLSRNNLNYNNILLVLERLNSSCIQALNISDVKHAPSTLPVNAFESFEENSSLNSLQLQNWNLVQVYGAAFRNLTNLNTLDLSNNKILALNMEGLDNVTHLNLTLNELPGLPNMCNANNESLVPKLMYLWLAINHISDSSEFCRQGHCLPDLRYLNLSFNAVSIIKNNAFSTISKLEKLGLENMLTYDLLIEEDAFRSKSLIELFISMPKRDTKQLLKHKTIFNNCPKLKTLDVSHFDFLSFDRDDFYNMLLPLKNLKNLMLRHCSLNFVPPTSHLSNLKSINLKGNFIRYIDRDLFQNNSVLSEIILRKNHLTTIKQDSFTEIIWNNPNLSIDVSYNPFACDCDLEWFIQWSNKNIKHVNKYEENQCDSPKEWKTSHIGGHLNSLKMTCHVLNRAIVIGLITGSFVFIFLFIFVLIRKFRWDILYYLHNFTHGRRRGYQRLLDTNTKEYDGFVAYNTHDRKWIMSELVDILEKKENYKLCLHERNFLPIGSHVDNIFDNIESSRKLILVLSNNFMEDQWCQFETVIANHQLADGNKDKILLIILDDIDSEHFTIALKTLLKEAKSVEWTTNDNGIKLFWKKINSFMQKY